MENTTSLQDHAESITDPRQQAKVMQPLDEILLPVLCGVVSGCEGFVDIALYGRERPEFLRRPAPFRSGIPSHDTHIAVFRALDPRESGVAFSRWAAGLAGRVEGATVTIDGRTARGSATGASSVLGQQFCRHGRNETGDIPDLPDLLSVEGSTVTLDAMGCRSETAAGIRERGADCVPTLKCNRGHLHHDVKLWFDEREHEDVQSHQSVDGDRGMVETGTCTRCDGIEWPESATPDGRNRSVSASSPRSGTTRRSGRGRGTSSRPCRWTRPVSPTRCTRTGRSGKVSIGFSTSRSGRTTTGFERTTAPTTLP